MTISHIEWVSGKVVNSSFKTYISCTNPIILFFKKKREHFLIEPKYNKYKWVLMHNTYVSFDKKLEQKGVKTLISES